MPNRMLTDSRRKKLRMPRNEMIRGRETHVQASSDARHARAPPTPPKGYLYPGYVVNTEVDGVGVVCVCVSVICLKYNLVRVCVCVCACASVRGCVNTCMYGI